MVDAGWGFDATGNKCPGGIVTDFNYATKMQHTLGNEVPDTSVALSDGPAISLCNCQENFTRRNLLKNQKGFTLLELLVAITLMAIGILSVLGMQTVALRSNTNAYQLSVATSLGQQVLEDILSWDTSDARINPVGQADAQFLAYFPDVANPANPFITIQGAGVFTPTYSRTFPAAGNGVPTGTVMIVVTVTYANNKTVTMTGFKRLV
jgi:type IV pilus assembly protein PilV